MVTINVLQVIKELPLIKTLFSRNQLSVNILKFFASAY